MSNLDITTLKEKTTKHTHTTTTHHWLVWWISNKLRWCNHAPLYTETTVKSSIR